jgi:hypothetical protein
MKAYVWSIVLYGSETMIIEDAERRRLEAFKVWCYRRMRISWMDKVRNQEVFRRTGEKRSLWKKLVKRR